MAFSDIACMVLLNDASCAHASAFIEPNRSMESYFRSCEKSFEFVHWTVIAHDQGFFILCLNITSFLCLCFCAGWIEEHVLITNGLTDDIGLERF